MQRATQDSLVVLDELGRGTSTFDGYAIAHAVLKHISSQVDCRLLFATHYHPLTTEFSSNPMVSLGHMAALVGSSGMSYDSLCQLSQLRSVSALHALDRSYYHSIQYTCVTVLLQCIGSALFYGLIGKASPCILELICRRHVACQALYCFTSTGLHQARFGILKSVVSSQEYLDACQCNSCL